MKYAQIPQVSSVRNIARSAQQKIRNRTGIKVTVVLYPSETEAVSPQQMLNVIALALGMSPECYQLRTRVRSVAELRFLGAYFLRMNFPRITLQQIAELYGGQDHSSIISGLTRAQNLIYTKDKNFLEKYEKALRSVNRWLRAETLDTTTAISA